MSNIIDSIKLSGTVYTLSAQTSGGNPTVELTQAEYDALVTAGTVASDTYYIITDATAINMSNYYTTAQTQSAITQAVSGKQDTLSAGTGIDITDNVISVTGGGGGGGAVYSAGTNIDITNDVISMTVPISGGGGSDSIVHGSSVVAAGAYSHAEGMTSHAIGVGSHVEGVDTYANAQFSHAEGAETVAGGNFSHTEGVGTVANNIGEHAEGWYNLSATAATDSGSTLFSVGNGTTSNDRHNALEIRKNGDIYCNNGTSDVKLQDYIQFKMVQITQAAYDALSPNYDANTIYYIVN